MAEAHQHPLIKRGYLLYIYCKRWHGGRGGGAPAPQILHWLSRKIFCVVCFLSQSIFQNIWSLDGCDILDITVKQPKRPLFVKIECKMINISVHFEYLVVIAALCKTESKMIMM